MSRKEDTEHSASNWLVCQLGGREHYAIARALKQAGRLECLVTDFWCPPGSWMSRVTALSRLHDRCHSDLDRCETEASNERFLLEEAIGRVKRLRGWDRVLQRNDWFGSFASRKIRAAAKRASVVFAYSYATSGLFDAAEEGGMKVVVGQIDPGPEEERIVAQEHERYDWIDSHWRPAPSRYWELWHEEMERSDRIVVNSPWSMKCLDTEGVDVSKVDVVPLVYKNDRQRSDTTVASTPDHPDTKKWEILFLGQINLRKGIGRLIEAMRLLQDDTRFRLTLVGPSEVSSDLWAGLENVRWLGPLRRSEVDQMYRQASVFILPTLSDGYALTQLEALSNGIPVIASQRCGPAVQDGINGLILKDLDPQTIASAIVKSYETDFFIEERAPFGLDELAHRLTQIGDQLGVALNDQHPASDRRLHHG